MFAPVILVDGLSRDWLGIIVFNKVTVPKVKMGGKKKKLDVAKGDSTTDGLRPHCSRQVIDNPINSAIDLTMRAKAAGIRTSKKIAAVNAAQKNDSSSDDNLYIDERSESERKQINFQEAQPFSRPAIRFSRVRKLIKGPSENTPLDYFLLVFSDHIFNSIVEKINSNIKRPPECSSSTAGKIRYCEKVSRGEFEVFLSLLYLMGFDKLPSIEDYWNQVNIFNNYMSYHRFIQIFNCIDFSEVITGPIITDSNNCEELSRVQPLMNMFTERMNEVYIPGKELMIEKPLTIVDTVKNEGVKIYALAEPTGLVLKTLIYGINDKKLHSKDHELNVVRKLMERYLFFGHSLYLSDLYGSIELASELIRHNINTTAKIRHNRMPNPPDFLNRTLCSEEDLAQQFTDDGVCVIKWCDNQKNAVVMLSTEYSGVLTNTKLDDKLSTMPHMLGWYKLYMYSYRAASFMDYYPLEKNDIRWNLKVVINIFYSILYNSHILYYLFSGKYIQLMKFQLTIIKALISKNVKSGQHHSTFHQQRPLKPLNNPERPKQQSDEQRVEQLKSHQQSPLKTIFNSNPIHVPGIKKIGCKIREPCKICFRRGILVDVQTYCTNCDSQPVLCIPNCFEQFHRHLAR